MADESGRLRGLWPGPVSDLQPGPLEDRTYRLEATSPDGRKTVFPRVKFGGVYAELHAAPPGGKEWTEIGYVRNTVKNTQIMLVRANGGAIIGFQAFDGPPVQAIFDIPASTPRDTEVKWLVKEDMKRVHTSDAFPVRPGDKVTVSWPSSHFTVDRQGVRNFLRPEDTPRRRPRGGFANGETLSFQPGVLTMTLDGPKVQLPHRTYVCKNDGCKRAGEAVTIQATAGPTPGVVSWPAYICQGCVMEMCIVPEKETKKKPTALEFLRARLDEKEKKELSSCRWDGYHDRRCEECGHRVYGVDHDSRNGSVVRPCGHLLKAAMKPNPDSRIIAAIQAQRSVLLYLEKDMGMIGTQIQARQVLNQLCQEYSDHPDCPPPRTEASYTDIPPKFITPTF